MVDKNVKRKKRLETHREFIILKNVKNYPKIFKTFWVFKFQEKCLICILFKEKKNLFQTSTLQISSYVYLHPFMRLTMRKKFLVRCHNIFEKWSFKKFENSKSLKN